jgi:hypothetical protein
MTLNSDGSVSFSTGDSGTWVAKGKKVKIEVDGGAATYHGNKTKAGLGTQPAPGKMKTVNGARGTWFGVYQTSDSQVPATSASAATGRR